MNQAIRYLRVHLKGGYVLALAAIPAIIFIIIAWDTIAVTRFHISPIRALAMMPSIPQALQTVVLILALIFVVPIFFAPWSAFSRGTRPITRILRSRSKIWQLIYPMLCLLCGYGAIYCKNLQILSGPAMGGVFEEPAYHSVFLLIQGKIPSVLWTIAGISFGLLGVLRTVLGLPRIVSFKEYIARLELSALPHEYAPIHGRRTINLNSGGLAPALNGIAVKWWKQVEEYQSKGPSSITARSFLEERWSQCKLLLKEFGVYESAGRQLRMFNSTSRALEISLAGIDQEAPVFLSPYEHPSEYAVVLQARPHSIPISVSEDFFEHQWTQQKEIILDAIFRPLLDGGTDSPTLIVSEVCWATGQVIPIADLVTAIREKHSSYSLPEALNPSVIIDGAHAVGNVSGQRPTMEGIAYIFSGHKWLLSPEPCGLCVSSGTNYIYDEWVANLPGATVGASQVCGLETALAFINEHEEKFRGNRAAALKDHLIKNLSPHCVVVGAGSNLVGSQLFSIRPNQGNSWAVKNHEIAESLATRNIIAEVITKISLTELDTAWVRLCVPYYLDWRTISEAVRQLRAIVQ